MSSKVKVLRSTVAGKRPTGKEFGELWVNDKDKVMGYIDSGGQPVVPFALPSDIVIHNFSATTAYNAGDVVLGPDHNLWIAKAAIPAGAWDATKWDQSGDSRFVNVAGDTMTGALNLPADGLTVGTNQLVAKDGRVGIGTTSPGNKLEILNDVAAPTSLDPTSIKLSNNFDGGSGIEFLNNVSGKSKISFGVEGTGTSTNNTYLGFSTCLKAGALTERMRIDSSGNLGLGVTPSNAYTPGKVLQIIEGGVTLYGSQTTASLANNVNIDAAGNDLYQRSDFATQYRQAAGTHGWSTAPSGTAGNPITFKQAMTLDASGNLGLGTSPLGSNYSSKCTTINIKGNDTGKIGAVVVESYGETYTSIIELFASDSVNEAGLFIRDPDTEMAFYTGPTPDKSMTLDPSGNLTIAGPTATKASGTAWAVSSDVRLKDNIQPFAKGLNELLKVDVKTWEYNGKGGTVAGTKGLGVIADEIMQVLPDTVNTYSAKLNPDDVEDTDIKRFDATEITWLLVNAVKEQQALITDLQTRLAALEAKP